MSCESVRLTLDADFVSLKQLEPAVNSVLANLTTLAEPANTGYNVLLALHELCTNIVRHAYAGEPGAIDVEMKIDGQIPQLSIRVCDKGSNEFDMNRLSKPDLVEPSLGGMGLWLITQLMDVVEYRRTGDSNEWLLMKRLETVFPDVESAH